MQIKVLMLCCREHSVVSRDVNIAFTICHYMNNDHIGNPAFEPLLLLLLALHLITCRILSGVLNRMPDSWYFASLWAGCSILASTKLLALEIPAALFVDFQFHDWWFSCIFNECPGLGAVGIVVSFPSPVSWGGRRGRGISAFVSDSFSLAWAASRGIVVLTGGQVFSIVSRDICGITLLYSRQICIVIIEACMQSPGWPTVSCGLRAWKMNWDGEAIVCFKK